MSAQRTKNTFSLEEFAFSTMHGHWVLAMMRKKVLRPEGLGQ